MPKTLLTLAFLLASIAPTAAAGSHGGMGGGHFGGGHFGGGHFSGGPIFHPHFGGMGGHVPGSMGEFHAHHFGFHRHFFGAQSFDGGDDSYDYSPVWQCNWEHWQGRWRKICSSD